MKKTLPGDAAPAEPSSDVTRLLQRYRDGDNEALNRLVPLVQAELHRLAESYLRRERPGHTLQPTALVNEAFITLIRQKDAVFKNRSHFVAVAALAMRQALVAHARTKKAQKRGGAWARVAFDEAMLLPGGTETDVLALDEALTELAKESPRQSRVVELRYFGGLTVEETAEALEVSPRTVKREWMVARAWLYRRLAEAPDAQS